MPVSFSNYTSQPKANSLVVCSGTGTVKKVEEMGSGFETFHQLFSNDIHCDDLTGGWKAAQQGILDLFFQKKGSVPPYIRIAKQDTLIGGIAVVPVRTSNKLFDELQKSQYRQAVRAAIQDAMNLNRPLYIQSLGIGVYGWSPVEAAMLFSEVIQEEDPRDQMEITVPIFDETPGSKDQVFRSTLIQHIKESVIGVQSTLKREDLPPEIMHRNEANEMSDHHLQVSVNARVVSQNLQGPYAIKTNAGGAWCFDLPCFMKPSTNKDVVDYLAALSGMTVNDCLTLLTFMATEQISKTAPSKTRLFLEELSSRYPGIGDSLGEGGYRLSIESDDRYKARMGKQIEHLKRSLTDGAEVLCFQEQPYDLPHDQNRKIIFQVLMGDHGFTQVVGLAKRDVGIWAKKEVAHLYQPVSDASLVAMVNNDPFRGCLIQKPGFIYVNLHSYTRGLNNTQYIQKLCALKTACEVYAKTQLPPAQLAICGDLNLYRFSLNDKEMLEAGGFTLELVKGQKELQDINKGGSFLPSYEAFVLEKKTVKTVHASVPESKVDKIVLASVPESKVVILDQVSVLEKKVVKTLYYKYENMNRFHLFQTKYKGVCGDPAKALILRELREEIDKIGSLSNISEFKKKLETDARYKLLKQSQGLMTCLIGIFGFKTSSIEALEKIIQERESELNNVRSSL